LRTLNVYGYKGHFGNISAIKKQVDRTQATKKANYFAKMEKQILTLVHNNELKFPFNYIGVFNHEDI